ncbi:MAG TPA: hypothetical protein VK177_04230, partial [Flavobacteriales bacterium]|nr:hypothetical protein [Flavobacteriales bacterium]
MKILAVVFLFIGYTHSAAQVNFAIGNYYRHYLIPLERYYKELKMGFDQEFYTPLVLKLKGNINTCTIEEVIPAQEAVKAKKYKEYKQYYEVEQNKKLQSNSTGKKKKRKRKKEKLEIELLTPRRNQGYYAYNFVYRFDHYSHMHAVTLNEVTLFDYNETEVRNSLSLFALTWKNNKPAALYFQDRDSKARKSGMCMVSIFDYFKKDGYTQHLHFSKEAAIDTSEK